MTLEREHKYLVSGEFPNPTQLQTAWAEAGVTLRPAGTRDQHDTYFDTPERALSAAGAALRVRRFGSETLATYKGPGDVVGSLHVREEIELPFVRPWPEAIRAKLASLGVGEAQPLPLLSLHTTRIRYLLARADGTPLAELSFDEVTAAHGDRKVTFRELELEAHPGTPEAPFEVLAGSLTLLGLLPHAGDKLTHALRLLGL